MADRRRRLDVAEQHELPEQQEAEDDDEEDDRDVGRRRDARDEDQRRREQPLRLVVAPHRLDRLVDGDEEDEMRRRGDGVVRDRVDDVERHVGERDRPHDSFGNDLGRSAAGHAVDHPGEREVEHRERRRADRSGEVERHRGERGEQQQLDFTRSRAHRPSADRRRRCSGRRPASPPRATARPAPARGTRRSPTPPRRR